jgi:hypothetical protein
MKYYSSNIYKHFGVQKEPVADPRLNTPSEALTVYSFLTDQAEGLGGSIKGGIPPSSTKKRIAECSSAYVITRKCEDCGQEYQSVGHCFIRYCEHCLGSRVGRAKKKLSQEMQHYPGILNHVILTIPRGQYSKERKRFLEDSKRKFFQALRRHHIQFQAIAVFDYGNPQGLDPLETNIHIHTALDIPGHFYLRQSFLQKLWSNATGIDNAVVRHVKARKRAVIKYFSKRIAGDFGHGNNQVLFKDFMTIEQFDNLVRGSRYLSVSLPKGISCKRSSQLSQEDRQTCECGGKLKVIRVVYMGEIVKDEIIYCECGISLIGVPRHYLEERGVKI